MLALVAGSVGWHPYQDKIPPKDQPTPRSIQCDDFKVIDDPTGEKLIMMSKAEVKDKDLYLKADMLLAWSKKSSVNLNEMELDEVYAEGNVVYMYGNFQVRADQLFMYLKRHQGIMINTYQYELDPKTATPSVFRAKEMRQIADGHWIAEKGTFSYCTYGVPHFDISAREVDITEVGKDEEGRAHRAQIKDFTGELWGIPFFYFPFMVLYNQSDFPLKSVKAGNTDRFGWVQSYEFGFTLRKGFVDGLTPFGENNPDDDRKVWGKLGLDVDYRRRRGLGYGPKIEYEWDGYKGFLEAYTMHDDGPDPGNKFDQKFLPMEKEDRGRIKFFHRQTLTDELRFELETSYLSDRNFLEEFYEQEFKEGREPETTLYGRWSHDNLALTYLERHRLNDFQTQVELLPQIQFSMYSEPLFRPTFSNLYLTTSSQIAEQRRRIDEADDLPSVRRRRFDQVVEVSAPYDLRLIQLLPFTSARLTAYEEDLDGHSANRLAFNYGLWGGIQARRTYDICSDTLNMNRVHHIMEFEGRFTHQPSVSIDPAELDNFDTIDQQDEFTEMAFKFNNRFQTKLGRYRPGVRDEWVEEIREFLAFGAEMEFYPSSRRDTTEFRVNNFQFPFNPVTLSRTATPVDSQDHSNIRWNAALTPAGYFALSTAGEFNPTDRREEEQETRATVTPVNGLSFHVSQHYFEDVTRTIGVGMNWSITEKWRLGFSNAYDYKLDRLSSRSLVLTRDMHDFDLQGILQDDRGRDEKIFWVSFVPKFGGHTVASPGQQDK